MKYTVTPTPATWCSAWFLQSVYGKPLAPSLRELFNFEEPGLGSTWMETLEDPRLGAADRAHQYMGELDTYDFDPSLDLYGGGGLVSTADDMAVFMRSLFVGGVYRDAATADTMLTTVAGAGAGPELSGSPMVPGRYRMGVEVRDLGGFEFYMHTGFWGTMPPISRARTSRSRSPSPSSSRGPVPCIRRRADRARRVDVSGARGGLTYGHTDRRRR